MRYIQKRHTRKKNKRTSKKFQNRFYHLHNNNFFFREGGGVTLGDNFSIWCSASVPVTTLCGHGFAPGAQNISLSLSPPWLQAIAHWNPSKRYSADNLQSESRRYRGFFFSYFSIYLRRSFGADSMYRLVPVVCGYIYLCVCVAICRVLKAIGPSPVRGKPNL